MGSRIARGITGAPSSWLISVSRSASSHSPVTTLTQASCQRASRQNGAHGSPASTPRSVAERNQRSASAHSAASSWERPSR